MHTDAVTGDGDAERPLRQLYAERLPCIHKLFVHARTLIDSH